MRSPRALLLALALAGLAGCITPSIPIPPPEADRMVFELDVDVGTGTFAYPPNDNYADAIVYPIAYLGFHVECVPIKPAVAGCQVSDSNLVTLTSGK